MGAHTIEDDQAFLYSILTRVQPDLYTGCWKWTGAQGRFTVPAERGPSGTGHDTEAATKLREQAETLAGSMSLRPLTPEECERGVNLIFDLLKYLPVAVPGPASEPICPGCKRPVSECQAEDVYEVVDAPGPDSARPHRLRLFWNRLQAKLHHAYPCGKCGYAYNCPDGECHS